MQPPDGDRPPGAGGFRQRNVDEPLHALRETTAFGARELRRVVRGAPRVLPGVLGTSVGRFVAVLLLLFVAVSVLQPGKDSVRAAISNELGQRRIAKLGPQIRAAAGEFGIDPYLVAALVFTESSGRVDAVSSAQALGLMQLKVVTAAERAQLLGVPPPTRERLLSDPVLNLRLGCAYLDYLLKRQEGSVDQALMAYNAGPTAFNRWLREAGGFEAWMEQQRAKGEPKLGTVRHYARKVQRVAEAYRAERLLR